ncbi:MAG: alkaline phosphatase D family protein [Limisphaerales bacterium]
MAKSAPKGRTRTLPEKQNSPERLRFAFASCQHYEAGFYTAYEHMAKEDLDMVFHLGDYIYEGPAREKGVRRHNSKEIFTLDDYRNRYGLYKSDPALQAMHAAAPWMVTWDDHEVDNNYAGMTPEEKSGNLIPFAQRRANAYKAYYEHMPLRRSSLPTAGRTCSFTGGWRLAGWQISSCSTRGNSEPTSRMATDSKLPVLKS